MCNNNNNNNNVKSVAFYIHINKEINVAFIDCTQPLVALVTVNVAQLPARAAQLRSHNRTHTHHKGRTQTQSSTNQCCP